QENRENIITIFAYLDGCSFIIDTHEIFVNIAAGSASAKNLMVYNLAHIALKEAKERQGKVIFYDDNITLKTKIQNNILMLGKIKSALKDDRFLPYFQGIVDNKTRCIVKYESLIRMIDEDGTVLSPYFFLEHAKKSNLYSALTQLMITKTFKRFEHLKTDFSINLLLEDIKNDETKDLLYTILQKSPATKHAIFEIVESEGIEDFDEVATFIDKLKSYGCRIAIDDFGTGYSNFSYLAQLNIDYIKIDGSLIKNITTNPDHLLAVESIVFFAHKKGIKTIAEFVEDEVTFNKLVDLGITYSQGYLFSVPSPKLED
ncbi:MAG: diguanylate phosphodiesterase, partial [Sulfuricurvum sp. 24-42-5]